MKYEKTAECPIELQKIIEAVNALPEETQFIEITNQLQAIVDSFADEDGTIYSVDPKDGFKYVEKAMDLGEMTFNYLFEDLTIFEYFEANNRLLRLDGVHILFHSIGEKNNQFIQQDWSFLKNNQTKSEYTNRIISHLESVNDFFTLSKLTIDKNGNIKPQKNELLEIFDKYDISFERIRLCPICENIFWAKRLEAPTCSKTCSNNFHQRKRRIKEYEKRLEDEVKKLKKLQSNLNPENNLVNEQNEKVKKLETKIEMEKQKNGNL